MDRQNVSSNAVARGQSLPYSEPILKPKFAANNPRAQARITNYNKTGILQRVLVQMSDWVKSRVSTIRIASALEPFILNATGKSPRVVSEKQIKALECALTFAQSVKNGSAEVINGAVSEALGKLSLEEKAGLREQLVTETRLSSSERVRDGLLYAVTASLQESISAEADFYVLGAVESIAAMIQLPFIVERDGIQSSRNFTTHLKHAPEALVKQVVRQASPYLNKHLLLVSPGANSVYQAHGGLSTDRQIACLSLTTAGKVRSWFSAVPRGLQNKVAAAIKQTVDDTTLQAANASDSAKRTRAFCIWLQETLVPDQTS